MLCRRASWKDFELHSSHYTWLCGERDIGMDGVECFDTDDTGSAIHQSTNLHIFMHAPLNCQ